jgi:hypothetical protein
VYGQNAQEILANLYDAYRFVELKQVTTRVLAYLRPIDKENLFEKPVVEQLPEIREDYLRVISKPMDFQRIEEERADTYSSISELEEDLKLIFQNAIQYNGAESLIGEFATEMLNTLDDAFEDALSVNHSRRKKKIRFDAIVQKHRTEGVIGQRKSSSGKSKMGNSNLTKRLREAEDQLKAERDKLKLERARVRQLERELADRDRIIQRLGETIPPNVVRHSSTTPVNPVREQAPAPGNGEGCLICGKDNDFDNMMLCDCCSGEYHYYCLTPPLSRVPDDDWYCALCAEQQRNMFGQ